MNDQEIKLLQKQVAELSAKVTQQQVFIDGFLNAAEIDPQIVRTLQSVLGGLSLSSLSDVELGTLSNNQVLKYRTSDSKWYNGTDEVV